jgi:uncharacterized protein
MEIRGLMLDPSTNVPIVILRDEAGDRLLPIWIGLFEANAIALSLEGVTSPRPLTHDLLQVFLERLGGALTRVLISELRATTYYAVLFVQTDSGEITIDSRPSDAIGLALRAKAPIFVAADVLEKARAIHVGAEQLDEKRLRKYLEELDPEDLGKYTM